MNNLKLTTSVVLGATLVAGLLLGTFGANAGGFTLPKAMVESAQHEEHTSRLDETPLDHAPGLSLPDRDKPKLIFPADMVKDAQKKPVLIFPADMVNGARSVPGKPDGEEILLALECAVTDDGLKLVNRSNVELPPGTKIKWQVKSLHSTGYFALSRALAVGKGASAAGLFTGGIAPDTICAAVVV